jgi:hypothetical protein
VKKWGLAPQTGSLAPPPPYGSEQGSILLESGREGAQTSHGGYLNGAHSRTRSGNLRYGPPQSPGPSRSPTDISLAQLSHVSTIEDVGEGYSGYGSVDIRHDSDGRGLGLAEALSSTSPGDTGNQEHDHSPPEYTSPDHSEDGSYDDDEEEGQLLPPPPGSPGIPSYDVATANDPPGRYQD